MRRAIEIFEANQGPEHPVVATAINNLAMLLQATNRLEEAEPLMGRGLAIFWRSLGFENPTPKQCDATTPSSSTKQDSPTPKSKPKSNPSSPLAEPVCPWEHSLQTDPFPWLSPPFPSPPAVQALSC
jgi:hypothetical protein